MVQILGWFKADAARASRWKRSRDCESLAKSSGKNFSATKRPSLVSWALYTTPIPPPPNFSVIRYWPRVSPIMDGFCAGILSAGVGQSQRIGVLNRGGCGAGRRINAQNAQEAGGRLDR